MEQCCAEGVDDSHGDSEAWPELSRYKKRMLPNVVTFNVLIYKYFFFSDCKNGEKPHWRIMRKIEFQSLKFV